MTPIFEQFNNILPISEKEVEDISPLLKTRTLAKDEFLLSENQLCNYMAFIVNGSFRHFHMNPNGCSTNIWLS